MKRYIIVFILVLKTFVFSQAAKACSCNEPFPFWTIDSLAQLENYEFIAHVKILEDKDYKRIKGTNETIGQLTIKIIELFKGKNIDEIIEYDKGTSCDIGISEGEEWVLFGVKVDGKIAVVACDRNKKYRGRNGFRDWKYDRGFYELSQLRKLYQHTIPTYKNEKHIEFYPNGQKEIEETYSNGKLNGERKIWYPNGQLFNKQYYVNDTLDGKTEWFYHTGQIYDEDFYIKGKSCNVSRLYYDATIRQKWDKDPDDSLEKTTDSLVFTYDKLQVQYETVFDSYGQIIIRREYTEQGKIKEESTYYPDKDFSVTIYYQSNGAISSISYYSKSKSYGHYQSYDKNGFPDSGWDYDENGEMIKSSIKKSRR